MPTTRRSSMNLALTPLDENIREAPAPGKQVKVAPATPGKQVKQLKTELEKKDAENTKLQSQLDELTKALAAKDELAVVVRKRNIVDKVEAIKLYFKYDVPKKVVDDVIQYKHASTVIKSKAVNEISDDVKKVY